MLQQAACGLFTVTEAEVSQSDGEGAFFSEQGGTRRQRRKESTPSFSFSADAAFTFYTPRAGGAHPLPGAAKDAKRP